MGGNPWDRNEGKFDVPSSGFPTKGEARNPGRPKSLSRAVAAEEGPGGYHGIEPVFLVVDGLRDFNPKPRRKPTAVAAPKVGKRLR